MKKLVDGVLVDMTPEEVAARQAEEAQWEAERPAREAREQAKAQRRARLLGYKKADLINNPALMADVLEDLLEERK